MSKCIFTYVNNIFDYKKIDRDYSFIFSNKKYGEDCLVLEKKACLLDCFIYLYKSNKFDKYIYISSKFDFNDIECYLLDNNFYLNYYQDFVYFMKYDYLLYKIFNIFENKVNKDNFINFLSDYYSSFDYVINKNFGKQFVFSENKFLYNKKYYEKFKN